MTVAAPLVVGFCFLGLLNNQFSSVAYAAVFNPNCTLPQSSTAFVAAPNTRGTLSILWNCLSTIILCTWNIQHLNIPSSRPYYDKTGKRFGRFTIAWWTILDMRINLRWMLLTLVVPEYIMGKALSERLAAISSLESLRSQFGDEIELVHAYIMNMGGYYLDFSKVSFTGVDVSNINASSSSALSSTAIDYSGVHFSRNLGDESRTYGESVSANLTENSQSKHNPILDTTKTLDVSPTNQRNVVVRWTDVESGSTDTCPQEICNPRSPDTPNDTQTPVVLGLSQSHRLDDHCGISLKSSVQKSPPRKMTSFQVLNLSRFKHERWVLTSLQLLNAKGFKLYETLPAISPQELESLSNSDSMVKLLALIQIGWLMIQLVVRSKNHIISSQLEVAALAFSVCSILTYVILWNRPRGVTKRYRIEAVKVPRPIEIISLATFGPGYIWLWHRFRAEEDENLNLMPIPNDASHAVDVRNLASGFGETAASRMVVEWLRHNHPAIVSVIVGSALGGTLFGAIHCLAWNFVFPTRAELVVWRICSIATTVLPILSIYFNLQWSYYHGWLEPSESTIAKTTSRFHGPVLLICFICPYVLARAFLLMETFRSLFFLPPEAFIDTWPGAFLLWG